MVTGGHQARTQPPGGSLLTLSGGGSSMVSATQALTRRRTIAFVALRILSASTRFWALVSLWRVSKLVLTTQSFYHRHEVPQMIWTQSRWGWRSWRDWYLSNANDNLVILDHLVWPADRAIFRSGYHTPHADTRFSCPWIIVLLFGVDAWGSGCSTQLWPWSSIGGRFPSAVHSETQPL